MVIAGASATKIDSIEVSRQARPAAPVPPASDVTNEELVQRRPLLQVVSPYAVPLTGRSEEPRGVDAALADVCAAPPIQTAKRSGAGLVVGCLLAMPALLGTVAPALASPLPADMTMSSTVNQGVLQPQAMNKWTILVYSNEIDDATTGFRNELQYLRSARTPDNLTVLVREGSNDYRRNVATDYRITPHGTAPLPGGVREEEMDLSRESVLQDFLTNGIKRFPARHVMLVVNAHGGGHKGISRDEAHQNRITVYELGQALRAAKEANGGRPIDVVVFNACVMSAAEVASQLKGTAGLLVGSQDVVFTPAYPLKTLVDLAHTFENTDDLAEAIVAHSNENFQSISVLRPVAMPPLEDALSKLSREIAALQPDVEGDASALARLRQAALSAQKSLDQTDVEHRQRVDLRSLSGKIAADPYLQSNRPTLVEAARDVQSHLSEVVSAERHAPTRAICGFDQCSTYNPHSQDTPGGMTILLPRARDASSVPYGEAYKPGEPPLELVQRTGWDRVIEKLALTASRGRGTVREVDPAHGTAVVQHEAVPALGLAAATSSFSVSSEDVLANLRAGDRVVFEVQRDGKTLIMTDAGRVVQEHADD